MWRGWEGLPSGLCHKRVSAFMCVWDVEGVSVCAPGVCVLKTSSPCAPYFGR